MPHQALTQLCHAWFDIFNIPVENNKNRSPDKYTHQYYENNIRPDIQLSLNLVTVMYKIVQFKNLQLSTCMNGGNRAWVANLFLKAYQLVSVARIWYYTQTLNAQSDNCWSVLHFFVCVCSVFSARTSTHRINKNTGLTIPILTVQWSVIVFENSKWRLFAHLLNNMGTLVCTTLAYIPKMGARVFGGCFFYGMCAAQ